MSLAIDKKQERKLIVTERRGKDITGIGQELDIESTKLLENLLEMEAEENEGLATEDYFT